MTVDTTLHGSVLQAEKRMYNRAVFLDLNGTIILPLKQESLDELTLIPGADLATQRLLDAGFLCPVVTVQSRIEKGLPTQIQPSMSLRKPIPYLYEQAAADFFRR